MTAALEGGEWSAAHPGCSLPPQERPGTHFTGGWVGPRAGMDGRKISSPLGFDPGPSRVISYIAVKILDSPVTHKKAATGSTQKL